MCSVQIAATSHHQPLSQRSGDPRVPIVRKLVAEFSQLLGVAFAEIGHVKYYQSAGEDGAIGRELRLNGGDDLPHLHAAEVDDQFHHQTADRIDIDDRSCVAAGL